MKKKNSKSSASLSERKSCCLAMLALFLGLTTPVQAQIWSEEFNYTSAPDETLWSYDLGASGWGNSELQNYTANTSNVWVDGSNLVITAIRQGNDFTSGRIKTQDKLTFKYGTIEARIQTPDLENGLWPAFWTLGNNFSTVGWPSCGEIDIMEMGHSSAIAESCVNRRIGSAAHWEYNGGNKHDSLKNDRPSDIDGTFVIYRMEWTPTSISTYIDGVSIWTMDISGGAGSDLEEFHEPHFMLLNLAVGGTYTGIYDPNNITATFPAEYRIDWIRLYDNGHTVLGGTYTSSSTPYHGIPMAIPGTIEAEDFDAGGQYVAYEDSSTTNEGGSYRPSEGVDIEDCSEGGYNVGWTSAGEWMKYTVNVSTGGTYSIRSRVARGTEEAAAFHIEADGIDVTGSIQVENTGGWQSWADKTSNASLCSGEQVVKVVIETGEININNFEFVLISQTNSPPTFTTDPITMTNATENAAYTATIADSATDTDAGDTLSYSLVPGGPAWLNMTTNGALSGTPGPDDVGYNSWTVQVSDGTDSATATLEITVEALADASNLLTNPGFESGTTGWNMNLSGGSASTSSTYAHGGVFSLQIDSSDAGGWACPNAVQSIAASPGDVFNVKGYMLNPAASPITGSAFGLFKIEFRNGSGAILQPASVDIGTSTGAPYYGAESTPKLTAASATDTWIFSEAQAEAPAGTATVGFYLLNVNPPGNVGPMYFDDIRATLVGDPVLPFTLSTSVVGENFVISFPAQSGVSYQVVYKSSLTNANWIPIETIVGDGSTNTVSYPLDSSNRFYHVETL